MAWEVTDVAEVSTLVPDGFREVDAENIITDANYGNTIADGPNTQTPWTFVQFPEIDGQGPDESSYEAPLSDDDAEKVKLAVRKSNEAYAAATTKPAINSSPVANDNPPSKDQVGSTLADALGNLDIVGKIGDDISDIVAGKTAASLHWWGWELQLDDKGTKALIDLLGVEDTKLVAVLAAFSALIPEIAAIAGIFGVVSAAFAGIVKAADKDKGVKLRGYLWVGLSAHSL